MKLPITTSSQVFQLLLLLSVFIVLTSSNFNSGIPTEYQLTLSVPSAYVPGFIGRALLMAAPSSPPPGFTTALVVEAMDGQYACSLDLYVGTNVRVWSSGHRSKFFTTGICVLELTQHGDLRLKGADDVVGWRTGTTEQGVQKLELLDSGNLVLVNGLGKIIWQSFNFPTNTLLLGQRLSVATHLTAYPTTTNDSYHYYSLEIQHDKLALYLNTIPPTTSNSKTEKYSYWELQPSEGKNITFVELTSAGLELFDDSFRKFAQIEAESSVDVDAAVRFMSLDNATGNLEMYCHKQAGRLDPCFKAINSSSRCDLPMTCQSNYSVCTSSSSGCSCIHVTTDAAKQGKIKSRDSVAARDCGKGIGEDVSDCGGGSGRKEEEMIEVEGAVSVFKSGSYAVSNVSRDGCARLCLQDCGGCRGVMYYYEESECVVYGWVLGVKEIGRGEGEKKKQQQQKQSVYMVKVGKNVESKKSRSGLKGWVLAVVVVGDGFILLAVVGGIGYFVIWRRRQKISLASEN